MIVGFIRKPVQKPRRVQPECPVRLYSYLCSVEKRSGAHCVQLRFVNCSAKKVDSLFLRICGVGKDGEICYTLEALPLTGCGAEPRSVFGEERLMILPSAEIAELEITVQWVLFSDGMLWKRLPAHRLDSPEALGMVQCICGMWNAAEAESCAFCARPVAPSMPLQHELTVTSRIQGEYIPVPELSMEEFESMMQETAAVLRSMQEETEPEEEDDGSVVMEEETSNKGSRSIWVMLCIIVLLILAAAGILYYKGYFG